jgi:hypothetical protein
VTGSQTNLEKLLESDEYPTIARLYSWGLNYESRSNPFVLFLDLIGYSHDQFGESMYDLDRDENHLGYLELDYLGDALTTYASVGSDAYRYVERLMEAEMEENNG